MTPITVRYVPRLIDVCSPSCSTFGHVLNLLFGDRLFENDDHGPGGRRET